MTLLARRRGLHIDGRRPVGSLPGQPNFANFVDLQESVSVKPFQNFLFISLNDQRAPGCGQTVSGHTPFPSSRLPAKTGLS